MGDKTKIDWCDASWNPVTGCLHGCEYCYARNMANRFGGFDFCNCADIEQPSQEIKDIMKGMRYYRYPKNGGDAAIAPYPFGFAPTIHRDKLDKPQKWTRPRTIFVCSMADLFGDWVPDEWIQEVFDACTRAPQHRYLFLTKNPARYWKLADKGILIPKTIEWWYGYTVDGLRELPDCRPIGLHAFVSVEPLLRAPDANMLEGIAKASWIIVGAETGNRKGKVIPEKAWIDQIVHKAQSAWMTPVFMKESLREIMGKDFMQEFPWEV